MSDLTLKHVCMWTVNGWKRITPDEAPLDGLFMCELCGQYVNLAAGEIRIWHFRHKSVYDDKTCPERTHGSFYDIIAKPREHGLPIRLLLSGGKLMFELGLPRIPKSILEKYRDTKITIIRADGKAIPYSHSSMGMTYINVGNLLSGDCCINAPDVLGFFLPKRVKGIHFNKLIRGYIFDKRTGKQLPIDSDVQMDKKYYLLTQENINYHMDIECRIVREYGIHKLYEVSAKRLSRASAGFFLRYRYWLNDDPMRLNIVWPLHIEAPYTVMHNKNYAIFFLDGIRRASVKTLSEYGKVASSANEKVLRVPANQTQIIAVCVSSVIQYFCLVREEMNHTLSRPELVQKIDVRDGRNGIIVQGEQSGTPAGGVVTVRTPFDGFALVRRNGELPDKHKLFAGECCSIQGMQYASEITIFQGLDKVFHASFVKAEADDDNDDEDDALLAKLRGFRGNLVSVPCSLGGAAEKLSGFPRVREWLYESARRGEISEQAVKLLRRYITDMEG